MMAANTRLPTRRGTSSRRVSTTQPTLSATANATRQTQNVTKNALTPRRPGATDMPVTIDLEI